MTVKPDPYRVLSVSPDASQTTIKKSYHKLVKIYHPDLNKNTPSVITKFREIQTAYEILRDKEKRRAFDIGLKNYSNLNSKQQPTVDDLWNLFRKRTPSQEKPSSINLDVWHSISIPFKLACLGGKKTISLKNGRKITIIIPPESYDGVRLRVKEQGLTKGLNKGDLFIILQVPEDPYFKIKNKDVHVDVAISLKKAVLGGKITITTLHGKVSVHIKPETNYGTSLRIKGKGMPASKKNNSLVGDCYAHIKIYLPSPIPQRLKVIAINLPDTEEIINLK